MRVTRENLGVAGAAYLCEPRRGRTRAERGIALVIVMWVIVLWALLLTGAQRSAAFSHATAHTRLSAVQARWLARAGVEAAIAELSDDGAAYDATIDYWYDSPLAFKEYELKDGYTFDVIAPPANPADGPRFGVIDLSSRVNINEADEATLKRLPNLTGGQVDAILDWRDRDDTIRTSGAEAGYYERLDFPYSMRNGSFQTMRELLLVRDVTDETYYGEDRNLNGLLDENENDGSRSWPTDNADGTLNVGLASLTTIYSYERNVDQMGVNRLDVNKASAGDWVAKFTFTKILADAVIKKRGNGKFNQFWDMVGIKPEKNAKEDPNEPEDAVREIDLAWVANHLESLTNTDDKRLPGRINVNTASKDVLLTVPGMTDEKADDIINWRDAAQGPFARLGELLTSKVLDEKEFKEIVPHLTVRSNVFEIHSRGRTPWGVEHRITAVVDRGASPVKVLYWYESE